MKESHLLIAIQIWINKPVKATIHISDSTLSNRAQVSQKYSSRDQKVSKVKSNESKTQLDLSKRIVYATPYHEYGYPQNDERIESFDSHEIECLKGNNPGLIPLDSLHKVSLKYGINEELTFECDQTSKEIQLDYPNAEYKNMWSQVRKRYIENHDSIDISKLPT